MDLFLLESVFTNSLGWRSVFSPRFLVFVARCRARLATPFLEWCFSSETRTTRGKDLRRGSQSTNFFNKITSLGHEFDTISLPPPVSIGRLVIYSFSMAAAAPQASSKKSSVPKQLPVADLLDGLGSWVAATQSARVPLVASVVLNSNDAECFLRAIW